MKGSLEVLCAYFTRKDTHLSDHPKVVPLSSASQLDLPLKLASTCSLLGILCTGEQALHLQGDFTWEESAAPSLTNLDAAVNAGDLMVVVGPTGSGKSSLLGAALGLMQQVSGDPVNLRGKASTTEGCHMGCHMLTHTHTHTLTHTLKFAHSTP